MILEIHELGIRHNLYEEDEWRLTDEYNDILSEFDYDYNMVLEEKRYVVCITFIENIDDSIDTPRVRAIDLENDAVYDMNRRSYHGFISKISKKFQKELENGK